MATGIGARVERKEDARHLSGNAMFVGDVQLPNLWEVAYVRSPSGAGSVWAGQFRAWQLPGHEWHGALSHGLRIARESQQDVMEE